LKRQDGNETGGLTVEMVTGQLDITPRTLRYYEEVGLISPVARTAGGHRLYDENTVGYLRQILRLKRHLGISLEEIEEILTAEKSLEELKQSFRANGHFPDVQRRLVERYIEVLRKLVEKMDAKIEAISTMRRTYEESLEHSIRFLKEEMQERDERQ